MRKLSVMIAFWLIFLACSSPVFADSIQNKTSEMDITIMESPITLNHVSAPTFSETPEQSVGQRLQAASDFVVVVQDKRDIKRTPWQLSYQLSAFDKAESVGISLELGKGVVTPIGDNQPIQYEARHVSTGKGSSETLVDALSTSHTQYEYRIPKEGIHLDIPTALGAGTYTARQTVTLMNIPTAH